MDVVRQAADALGVGVSVCISRSVGKHEQQQSMAEATVAVTVNGDADDGCDCAVVGAWRELCANHKCNESWCVCGAMECYNGTQGHMCVWRELCARAKGDGCVRIMVLLVL